MFIKYKVVLIYSTNIIKVVEILLKRRIHLKCSGHRTIYLYMLHSFWHAIPIKLCFSKIIWQDCLILFYTLTCWHTFLTQWVHAVFKMPFHIYWQNSSSGDLSIRSGLVWFNLQIICNTCGPANYRQTFQDIHCSLIVYRNSNF